MSVKIYRRVHELQGFSLKNCPAMPAPTAALMCPPDHYQVLAVKNPYMSGQVGAVDRAKARRQWEQVREAFDAAGLPVETATPVEGLEDMTFCANPSLAGLRPDGERVAVLGAMRHPSRRREVDAFETWYKARGWRTVRLKPGSHHTFEGSGDAVWHPGRRLLWAGHGFRSDPETFAQIARAFETPIIELKLVNARFYHLDTCFCPLTTEAVLIHPAAFDAASLELILKIFPIVVTANEADAGARMACNAAVVGRTAIIQKGATTVSNHMLALGLGVCEVDTSEFIKSGGSVYCMKQFLFGRRR